MSDESTLPTRRAVVIERSYDGPVEDLWALWTTKEGFESWWGPEGFRVKVHALDLRIGGELVYEMIAVDDEQIAFMQRAGRPLSHEARATFVELEPPRHLRLRHMIDFLPGVDPYEHNMLVALVVEGETVRMVIAADPYHDEETTRLSTIGLKSQLTKVPAALAARRA